MKLEVVLPVADVERAKDFYGQPGGTSGRVSSGPAPDHESYRSFATFGDPERETRIGAADPDWPDRYAARLVAGQAGTELPA